MIPFRVILSDRAEEDLKFFEAFEQRMILDEIQEALSEDAHLENQRRKKLEPNPLAPWELKVGDFRVFYSWTMSAHDSGSVEVVAIGKKDHNELRIRDQTVDL